ncbi:MAG: hypothetical protein ACR2K2_02830 [Mycobacteriales bacterium]
MTARRTDTQSIEVDADPADVLGLLAAARRLPEWASAFADTVEPADGAGRWTASKSGQESPLRVLVDEGSRTVDYLPGNDGDIGGHTRVLPRPGGGSVVLFTQPLPPDADAARATVTAELHALRALLDHQPPEPAVP